MSEQTESRRGRLFVIEGLDGSGKATQAQLLYESLLQRGCAVRKISFPNYDSDSSALVKMYLAGDFGSDPGDVNAYAASTFFAVDRYASFKKDWSAFYRGGGVVIADRYTTSNAVHQCSKLPEREWECFLNWLFHFEYEMLGIPAPDRVFYLRTETALNEKLLSGRYEGHEERKDIHERNAGYLERSRAAAEYCAAHLGWTTVQCVKDGAMRPIEDIHAELLRLLDN